VCVLAAMAFTRAREREREVDAALETLATGRAEIGSRSDIPGLPNTSASRARSLLAKPTPLRSNGMKTTSSSSSPSKPS